MSYSGLYAYTDAPASGSCWVCLREVPVARRGRVPSLCGPKCTALWVARHSLDGAATHVVTDDDWEPLPPHPAPVEEPSAPTVTAKPGSWLRGKLARRN